MRFKKRQAKAKFDAIQFIGWDGEGINDCEIFHPKESFSPPHDCPGMVDEWTERQRLALIACSTGETLYNSNGITFDERMNFVRQMGRNYPNGTHVFFGGSYDFNKLLEGLPPDVLDELHESKQWVRHGQWIFRYRPRKELVIAHLKGDAYICEGDKVRDHCDSYIRLWDVIGFFQCSFIHAVKQWLGTEYEDYELIQAGKLARLHFDGDDKDFMIRYNAAEVKALVLIMEKLHKQLDRLGLRISRWDGAGAVAAEIFKRYRLTDSYYCSVDGGKPEKIQLSEELDEATRYGFFGGRIESGYMGSFRGKIFNYDINSAYPFAANLLPNLNYGEWKHQTEISLCDEIIDFGLYRVSWYFHEDRLYYPFPFRTMNGAVIFPKIGERWIYGPELKAAIASMRTHDAITIHEGYSFIPSIDADDERNTFRIVGELYKARQEMVRVKDPAEYPLKLGLNSVYGKLCQKLGWTADLEGGKSPRYHFLLFAGFITSYTRARIYSAIANYMDSVISINTDGIITSGPLDLEISTDKSFGAWSLEENDEIVQLQSGVYWLRKNDVWKEKARGLGRVVGEGLTDDERNQSRNEKIVQRISSVANGWKNNDRKIYFPVKLFVTSKKSRIGESWFPRWGHWYTMHDAKTKTPGRGLELLCSSWGKRRLDTRIDPARLNRTTPAENIAWSGDGDLGEIYNLPWLNSMSIPSIFDATDDDDLGDI